MIESKGANCRLRKICKKLENIFPFKDDGKIFVRDEAIRKYSLWFNQKTGLLEMFIKYKRNLYLMFLHQDK